MKASSGTLVGGIVLYAVGAFIMALGQALEERGSRNSNDGLIESLGAVFILGLVIVLIALILILVGVKRLSHNVDQTLAAVAQTLLLTTALHDRATGAASAPAPAPGADRGRRDALPPPPPPAPATGYGSVG